MAGRTCWTGQWMGRWLNRRVGCVDRAIRSAFLLPLLGVGLTRIGKG